MRGRERTLKRACSGMANWILGFSGPRAPCYPEGMATFVERMFTFVGMAKSTSTVEAGRHQSGEEGGEDHLTWALAHAFLGAEWVHAMTGMILVRGKGEGAGFKEYRAHGDVTVY